MFKKDMKMMIDTIVYSGGAFALNELGEQVFINSRLCSHLKLNEGEVVVGSVIVNYDDKKEATPWRLIKADLQNSDTDFEFCDKVA